MFASKFMIFQRSQVVKRFSLNINIYVKFCSISNILLSIKIPVFFHTKRWANGIKELKKYVKNALHFQAMNYCHVCDVDFYRHLNIRCAYA
jgi:hypothetical protein